MDTTYSRVEFLTTVYSFSTDWLTGQYPKNSPQTCSLLHGGSDIEFVPNSHTTSWKKNKIHHSQIISLLFGGEILIWIGYIHTLSPCFSINH